MTSVLMLTVMISAVLLNLAVLGERREMFFFKDVSDLNSAQLKLPMKDTQLLTNAHKEPRHLLKTHNLRNLYQLVLINQFPQVIQLLNQMLKEEFHCSTSWDTLILILLMVFQVSLEVSWKLMRKPISANAMVEFQRSLNKPKKNLRVSTGRILLTLPKTGLKYKIHGASSKTSLRKCQKRWTIAHQLLLT